MKPIISFDRVENSRSMVCGIKLDGEEQPIALSPINRYYNIARLIGLKRGPYGAVMPYTNYVDYREDRYIRFITTLVYLGFEV